MSSFLKNSGRIFVALSIFGFCLGQFTGYVSALSDEQKKLYNQNILYYDLESCPEGGSTVLAGDSNEEKIWNFLITELGFNDLQAAGIMGNIEQESGFDPNALNPSSGAYGIVQWYAGRRTALESFAASKGTDKSDLGTQLEFLKKELETDYKSSVYDPILAASTMEEALLIWLERFEVPCLPGSCGHEVAIRTPFAQKWLDEFGGSGGSGGSNSGECPDSSAAASCEQLNGTPKDIIDNVVLPIANDLGFDDTPESVDAANAAHGPTVTGGRSDHQGPPDQAWAADISNGTSPTPEMDELAKTLAGCFELPPEHWEGDLEGRDNQCNSISVRDGYRFQLIYRTNCGGNHYNHVHIGVRKE